MKALTLARRELTAQLYSPIAYLIGAGFLFVTAAGFSLYLWIATVASSSGPWGLLTGWTGGEATLGPLFDTMAGLMVFAVPLLTMGLLSKEFDSGTIETLMTSPVTETQVVLGKFLGAMVFYLVLLATTVVFLGLMMAFGRPDVGVAATGYLGMVLLGAAYISVGLFASALTRYQIVSAVVAVAILVFFAPLMTLLAWVGTVLDIRPLAGVAARLNAMAYFTNFSIGVFDSGGLVYFLSVTALFLFLSVKVLESRRWR